MTKSWKTRLIHTDAAAPTGFRSLVPPTHRGSTVIFPSAAAVEEGWDQHALGYTYGLYGTPTTLELAARVCELERGHRTVLVSGGQAAIALVDLAFLRAGEHVLLPENVYSPNRRLSRELLARFGVDVSFYPPGVGAGIATHLRPNTRLIWAENPGSITMEIEDLPALAGVAHEAGARVVLDNTWAAGVYYDAFAHGADVTVQALTKYVGGHSDLLLGSVTVKDEASYQKIGAAHAVLGYNASPDDCSLALRGLTTLAVRLAAVEKSALELARWLAARDEIARVLHPALPSCPGHELWRRDFTGSSGLFSIVFADRFSKEQVFRFVDALELFEIGYSWAGVTSLAVAYDFSRSRYCPQYGARVVRLNVGLEDTEDLRADLERALAAMT